MFTNDYHKIHETYSHVRENIVKKEYTPLQEENDEIRGNWFLQVNPKLDRQPNKDRLTLNIHDHDIEDHIDGLEFQSLDTKQWQSSNERVRAQLERLLFKIGYPVYDTTHAKIGTKPEPKLKVVPIFPEREPIGRGKVILRPIKENTEQEEYISELTQLNTESTGNLEKTLVEIIKIIENRKKVDQITPF